MLTNWQPNISQTRSRAVGASTAEVHAFLADGATLPAWAPGFAPGVRPDGDRWIVESEGGEFPVRLLSDDGAGTVDIVSAADPRVGAFMRVLPNGDGSEVLFTLFFPAGTPVAAVDAQMAVVEEELATVERLVALARGGAG